MGHKDYLRDRLNQSDQKETIYNILRQMFFYTVLVPVFITRILLDIIYVIALNIGAENNEYQYNYKRPLQKRLQIIHANTECECASLVSSDACLEKGW